MKLILQTFQNIIFFLCLISCIPSAFSYSARQATWGSGYDIQASTFSLFNYQLGDPSKSLSKTIMKVNFSFKYAFAQAPKAIAATTRYQGTHILILADASLLQQQYTGFYIEQTSTPVRMQLQILASTNIYQMQLRYIAINSDFPYHLNAYSNEQKSYNGSSTITAMKICSFLANYTAQAIKFPYNTFTPMANGDYSNNKVLLFISCWSYKGKLQTFYGQYPPQLNVTSSIVNSSHYAINIRVGINAKISKLHFNMLMFDADNIQGEGLHRLIYTRANFTDVDGGFMPVPKQYWNATLFGFTDFSSYSTSHYLFYHLYLGVLNDGRQGIIMQPPIHPIPSKIPIQRYGITLFYLQSLICPDDGFYFNHKSKMCYQLIIERSGCNQFSVMVPQCNYTRNDFQFLNQVVMITDVQQRGEDVFILASYSSSIVGEKLKIKFPSRQIIIIQYDPLTPAFHYDQYQCKAEQDVYRILLAFTSLSYFVLLVSLFVGKIVGLQLFGVLQLSYFILGSYDFINLYLKPLTNFKLFNGLNLNIIPQTSQLLISLTSLNISSNFLNNCNIMIFIMFIFIIVMGIITLFFKIKSKYSLYQRSTNIFKQGLITFTMFNCFNISYSAGTHIKYANSSDEFYGLGLFLIIIVFFTVFFTLFTICTSQKSKVGEFKQKFKPSWTNNLFILISILYRIILGLYCSLNNSYVLSTLITLGLSIAFLLYVLINLPFINVYQNYRTCLIHFTQIYIIFTANYYRSMRMNTPLSVKAFIFAPTVIQFVLIGMCIVVSLALLLYEGFKIIRKIWIEKRKKMRTSQVTNQSNDNSKHNLTIQQFTVKVQGK